MPHIHTEPGQHDITTTAFIIRTSGDHSFGFLHRHRKLKTLLPVGGHVELDETPWAAILHEIKEESGYEPSFSNPRKESRLKCYGYRMKKYKTDRIKCQPTSHRFMIFALKLL